LSKIVAENEELVKFFQIFERFTNLSSTGAKNAFNVQRKATEAVRFVLRTDPERETGSKGKKKVQKR
jgi:hypothetical protein